MHRQPFLAGELLVGNGGARGGAEYFGAATRKARDAGVFQGDQDVPDRQLLDAREVRDLDRREGDRKSTRLNSSHLVISYAVFCLKKKITMKLARHSCN